MLRRNKIAKKDWIIRIIIAVILIGVFVYWYKGGLNDPSFRYEVIYGYKTLMDTTTCDSPPPRRGTIAYLKTPLHHTEEEPYVSSKEEYDSARNNPEYLWSIVRVK